MKGCSSHTFGYCAGCDGCKETAKDYRVANPEVGRNATIAFRQRQKFKLNMENSGDLDGPGCGVENDDDECLCDVKNLERHPLIVVVAPSSEGLYPHETPEVDYLVALLRKRRLPFEVAPLFSGPYTADRAGEYEDHQAACYLRVYYPGRRLIFFGRRVAKAFDFIGPHTAWYGNMAWLPSYESELWETSYAKEAAAWLRRALVRKYD